MHAMRWSVGIALLGLAAHAAHAASGAVVIAAERVEQVARVLPDPTDLWIDPADLERVSGFELKPEGACLNEICVPVRQDTDSDIFITRGGERWFNVAELANRVRQPFAVDYDANVWSFGAIPAERAAFLEQGIAPDFELPDVDGERHRLSDFKGRKIMLLSWASW
jgi:hypothetical protein